MLEILKQIDLRLVVLALVIFFWAWYKGRMINQLLKEWRSESQKKDEKWQEEQRKREERWQEEQKRYQEEQQKREERWQEEQKRYLEEQQKRKRWQEEQRKRDEVWRQFFDNFDRRHIEHQKALMEALTKISDNLARR